MNTTQTNFVKEYKPGSQARVELKNGRILDVVNGCYFDAGTSVLLQDGKIVAMPGFQGESFDICPDFTIDLKGKTVLPSLFNTHCHVMGTGPTMIPSPSDMWLTKRTIEQQKAKYMADCLTHGITHVRDAWWADMRDVQAIRERIEQGDIPGPHILQAVAVGPTGSYLQEKLPLPMKLFGRPSSDPKKDYAGTVSFPVDATEKQVREAVDIALDERGAEVIKIGDESFSLFSFKPVPMMTIEQLDALVDQARRRGVQSTMHHSSVESFRRGIQVGVSSLAHIPYDAHLTDADVEAIKASDCLVDPTISVFYVMLSWKMAGNRSNGNPVLNRLTQFRDRTYTFADIADEYHIPELREVVIKAYKQCAGGNPKLMGILDGSKIFAWDTKVAIAFENLRLLHKHGVAMTTGNDTVAPCTPAMVGLELRMFDHVLMGDTEGLQFSGADAVKIATINSARSLGVEQEFGSIETGKKADLVILDGDPLHDFRLIGSQVAALFMNGTLVINNCGLEAKSNGGAKSFDAAYADGSA